MASLFNKGFIMKLVKKSSGWYEHTVGNILYTIERRDDLEAWTITEEYLDNSKRPYCWDAYPTKQYCVKVLKQFLGV